MEERDSIGFSSAQPLPAPASVFLNWTSQEELKNIATQALNLSSSLSQFLRSVRVIQIAALLSDQQILAFSATLNVMSPLTMTGVSVSAIVDVG
jgi:hypothetical protein